MQSAAGTTLPVGRWPIVLLAGTIAVVAAAALLPLPVQAIGPALAVLAFGVIAYRRLLRWQSMLIGLVLVILFIPIRRYTVPMNLPFQLEPYRIVVLLIALGWTASVLVDARTRPRTTGLEGAILLLLGAVVGSIVVNIGAISASGAMSNVTKSLIFFLSYFIVVYVIVSVVDDFAQVDQIIRILVAGGAVVAVSTVIENRTQFNIFDHIPFLRLVVFPDSPVRGARVRAYGSAQHPIAMGAALVMLLPFAIYLARRSRRWWAAVVLLLFGTLTTQSRTAIVMLLAMLLVYVWLRPLQTRRMWPALLPLLAAIHIALPATLGPLKDSFFPKGGLIADQSTSKGTIGQGRVADLSPGLRSWSTKPLLGQGFASHTVDDASITDSLAILDDQWLGTLLDTGVAGLVALAWLFIRFVRRCARASKGDDSDRGWMFVAFAAAVTGYAVGMLTFDAFAFIQVTILMFMLVSLGCVLLNERARMPRSVTSIVRPGD